MTNISTNDIKHLATLSAISLSDDEIEQIRPDIEKIVEYINQLQEIDTSGVEPTYQVTGLTNVWREDDIEPSISSQKLVGLAAAHNNNSIEVPKVL